MESSTEARSALAIAERASAAPYIDYPPTPKWYPPAAGVWAALVVFVLWGASGNKAIVFPGLAALLAAEVAFFAWYRRRWQTWPAMRGAPPEIRAAYRRYFVGVVAAVAVAVGVYVLLGVYATAAVVFVLVTAGLTIYERAYARAATATRRRLG